MRRLLIGIGIVLVLLIAAVVIVPMVVGTSQLTAFLTERLRSSTGYNVSIHGPVALSVLPSPHLSIEDIHVSEAAKQAGTELARVGSIDIHVALMPLMSGQVEVTAVTLKDPVVALEGPLSSAKPVAQTPPQPAAPPSSPSQPAAPAAEPASNKFSVAVRHVRVENGNFSYRDAGKAYQVDHLDLDLTTEASGAISGTADTGFNQDKLHVEGRMGSVDCAKPIPLSFHATAGAGGGVVDFAGSVHCNDGMPARADGKLKLGADSVRAALAPFTAAPVPPALDKRLVLDGTLGADRTKAELTGLTLDLDQTHAVGTLTAGLGDRPSLDATLDFNRLDLDKWLAAPPAPAAAPPTKAGGLVPTVPAGGPGPSLFADDLHIGLDLSAELVSWRGGLIRAARFNGGIDQGALTINQATAELPGGTDLSISGQVAEVFAIPHFMGTVDAETDDLRAVAGWAGLPLGGVPADRLRQASLSTTLDLAAERASATGLELGLDGSRFRGAANLVFGDQPAIGLRLAGDQLNLDAYLADAGTLSPASATTLLSPRLAANLDLSLDSVTWRGQLLKGVHLAGAVEDGTATVREARIGDLAGGSLSLAGRWSGAGPTATLSGQINASGPSAAPMLTLAGLDGQELAARLGAYRLDLGLDGSPGALDIDGVLAAQDGRLTAKGRLDLGAGVPHFAGDVTLEHPEASRLLALAAPLYRPAGGTLGALALSASLDASPGRVAANGLSLAVGDQKIEGRASVDRTAEPPQVSADLNAGDLALDPFLPVHDAADAAAPIRYAAVGDPGPLPGHWSHDKLDVSWLGLMDATVKLTAASVTANQWHLDKPSLACTLKGGTLGIDRLASGVFGGTVEAHGSLAQVPAGAGAKLALTFAGKDLDLKDLTQQFGSAALTSGTGTVDADVTASGASQADLVAALGGKASLVAKNGGVGGFDLAAISDKLKALKGPQDLIGVAQAVQGGGTTHFSALTATATITNGVVHSTDVHLAADGGDLTGTVTANLPAWTVDGRAQLAIAGRSDLPPLAMTFDGPLNNPEKKIDVNSLAAYAEKQGAGNLLNRLTGQQAAPASPSQQQQKPAQQLQNLLKGLTSKP